MDDPKLDGAPAANTDGQGTGQQGSPDAGNGGSDSAHAGADDLQNGSLMSRNAKAGEEGGQGTGQQGNPKDDPSGDPSAKVPDTPEGYDLKFDPKTQVDNGLLDDFRKTAKELGLTQGQAQKLGGMYEARMADAEKRMAEAQTKALLEARKGWEGEISKRPGFEAERGHIQAALRQFGDTELFDLLDQTNLGSHPKMWDFMAKVGKALAEPGFRGENTGQGKSAAEVLYPNMNH